jgi:hypothetical protein
VLAQGNLSEQELALVCNLQIRTADEARKLVPSLVRRRRRCAGPSARCRA